MTDIASKLTSILLHKTTGEVQTVLSLVQLYRPFKSLVVYPAVSKPEWIGCSSLDVLSLILHHSLPSKTVCGQKSSSRWISNSSLVDEGHLPSTHSVIHLLVVVVQVAFSHIDHVVVVQLQNLSVLVREVVVTVSQLHGALVFVEMKELGNPLLTDPGVLNLDWVANDSVVINLSNHVLLLQALVRDLIVIWAVEVLSLARNSQVDVSDSSSVVDEHDVPVVDESVQNQESKLDNEGENISHKSSSSVLLIVLSKEE